MLLITLPASAGSITFAWDASADAAGYKLFCGETMDALTTEIDVGNVLTHEITGLTTGITYICRAKAYDASGNESDLSGGAFGEVELMAPTALKVQ